MSRVQKNVFVIKQFILIVSSLIRLDFTARIQELQIRMGEVPLSSQVPNGMSVGIKTRE